MHKIVMVGMVWIFGYNSRQTLAPFQIMEILTRYPVLFRSYSRKKGDRRESWTEVCQRTIKDIGKLGNLTPEEASLLYEMQLTNKTFVSGRWLWVGGTDWIQVDRNFSGAYNCTSTKITDWDSFGLLMDLAMMGCGTGAVLESNLDQLPVIKNKLQVVVVDAVGDVPKSDRLQETKVKCHPDGTVDMWVGDSRQGWVGSYQKLLELSSDETFADGAIKIAVHIGNVRPKGEMLNGFGGVSNPIKLAEMYTRIAKILNRATGRKLTSLECCLLIDEAAVCVVAGNIRRSAGIRQFHQDDIEAATAKDNLWQQGEDGNWRIDPERDALRMANHTRVFQRKPTLEEVTSAVRKQFYSGEGAIQWAGEALARANADLLSSDRLKSNFLAKYSGGGTNAAKGYLSLLHLEKYGKEISDRELQHRSERYGLNPCLHGDTLVKVWNKMLSSDGWTFVPIKQLAESDSFVWIVDGKEDLWPVKFHLTQRNAKVLKLTLENNGIQETIIATPGHSFFKKTQLSQGRDSWDFNAHSLIKNGAKWERWAVDEMEIGDILLGPITTNEEWTIVAIEDTENADVYCTKVGSTRSFDLMFLHSGNCGEIIGSDYHCNLSEVHLNRINPDNFQEQREAFTAASLAVASLLHHRFVVERYQKSREFDPIVGVSFTGLFDFFVQAFGEDWLRWWEAGRPQQWNVQSAGQTHYYLSDWFTVQEQSYFSEWRKVVENTIKEYCDRHNLKMPNRTTCVQPGGTKSLLTGASPGWHPPFGQYYIRRITFAKNDPVALACLDAGYSVVPGQSDKDENGVLLIDPSDPRVTEWLVEIPVETQWGLPECDIDPSNFSALAMFDFYMQVQKYWTTHNTSATILFEEKDIDPLATRIYEAIRDDEGYISVALLARFESSFPRLPFEAINKETYDRMVNDIAGRKVASDFLESVTKYSQEIAIAPQDSACDGVKCELKEYLPNLI